MTVNSGILSAKNDSQGVNNDSFAVNGDIFFLSGVAVVSLPERAVLIHSPFQILVLVRHGQQTVFRSGNPAVRTGFV